MSIEHRWVAGLLALSLLVGCASTRPPAGTAAAHRIYVTGSRLAAPEDTLTGLPRTASPLLIVSSDELRYTGQVDVGAALRMLVPAIQ